MNNRQWSINKDQFWYFALFLHFCVALNQDWVTVQLFWWGSIMLLAVATILKNNGRIQLRSSSFLIWMVSFTVISALSSVYALSATIVFVYLKSLVVMLFVYYLIYNSINSPADINRIILVYVYSTVVIGIYLILTQGMNMFILSRTGDADAGNWNANSVGMMMLVTFLLSFVLINKSNSTLKNLCFLLIDAFCLYWVIVTASRKAVLILVGGVCLFVILLNPKKVIHNVLFVALLSLATFYILIEVPYFYNMIGWRLEGAFALFIGEGTVDNSSFERKIMIDLGIAWFKKNPILGYGMDNYRVLYGLVTSSPTYAHNNFVEIAVDLGIVGLIAYYWIYAKIVKEFFKDKARDKQIIVLFTLIMMYLVSHYALVAISELPQNIIIICIMARQTLKSKNNFSGRTDLNHE